MWTYSLIGNGHWRGWHGLYAEAANEVTLASFSGDYHSALKDRESKVAEDEPLNPFRPDVAGSEYPSDNR
jgi:hypothetical protein